MADPKRSMNSFLQLVKARAGEVEELLNTIPSGSRTSSRVITWIEDLEKKFKAQWDRLEDKYANILEESDLEEKDEDEVKTIYGKAKDIFNKSKANLERVLDAHDQVQANPAQGSNQVPTRKSPKIEELLKPKEPLSETMSLEEAEHWIKKYKAFLAHNKDVLNEEGLVVSRVILDNSLDPKLAAKLRNHTDEAG